MLLRGGYDQKGSWGKNMKKWKSEIILKKVKEKKSKKKKGGNLKKQYYFLPHK
jgi:hypothetical protein